MPDELHSASNGNFPGHITPAIDNPPRRSRRHGWLSVVLSIAAIGMTACSSANVKQGIFAVRTATGALTWIGEPAGVPVWSPDAGSVAWGSEDGLFLRVLEDALPRRFSDSPVAGVPSWSPDGRNLAYIDRDRVVLVVLGVPSGTEQFTQPLDRTGSSKDRFPLLALGGPTWAPDGSRIAYTCWDGAGDEICLIGSDGTQWRQVTRLEQRTSNGAPAPSALATANVGPPAWSPHGELLAVAVYPERPGAPTGVFLVEPDEGIGRRISSLQPNSAISWTPDGGSIIFSAFRRGRSDAFRVVLAANTLQRVTEDLPEGSRNPAISPDGSRIAVESGGGVVVLGLPGPVQAFRVSDLRSANPTWNPDDTAIAVSATSDAIEVYN
jgi:Tol biopolymer transport system component